MTSFGVLPPPPIRSKARSAKTAVANRSGIGSQPSQDASATAPTQAEAEKLAKELAISSGGGEVVVHTPSGPGVMGTIRDKDTVGKKDPFPPRG